jgi:hypothetical protein
VTKAVAKPVEVEIVAPGGVAIQYFLEAVASGREWPLAMLEAVGRWDVAEEMREGALWRYLLAGEALDWMLVAERLCEAAAGLIPENEVADLLFRGRAPIDITQEKFKELVGGERYRQYLNYFYGVTVEEALFWAVRGEVRKEQWASGLVGDRDPAGEVYRRVYQATGGVLLRRCRRELGYPLRRSTGLLEMKEFSYWLFKYRLKNIEMARVASDTRKALDWLRVNRIPLLPMPPL